MGMSGLGGHAMAQDELRCGLCRLPYERWSRFEPCAGVFVKPRHVVFRRKGIRPPHGTRRRPLLPYRTINALVRAELRRTDGFLAIIDEITRGRPPVSGRAFIVPINLGDA